MQQPMDEQSELPFEPKPTGKTPWGPILAASLLVVATVAGGFFTLHDRMLAQTAEQANEQNAAREKLAARIDSLQDSLTTISNKPAAEPEQLNTLDARLADVTSKLDALNARLDAVEKKLDEKKADPAPMAPAPLAAANSDLAALKLAALSGKPFSFALAAFAKAHPEAQKQIAALTPVAESGIPSEAELNRQLRDVLDGLNSAPTVDSESTIGKINSHLSGLVSIRKVTENGPYAALKRDVLREDIISLTRKVEALDDQTRMPLENWLKLAVARRNALAALDAMNGI